jgi:hypothetical protein
MALSEDDFASIKTLVERTISDRGEPFITGKVIKRDVPRQLVWLAECGDQPIPVIDFKLITNVYGMAIADEAFTLVTVGGDPGFEHSWVNFGAPHAACGFLKDALGNVRIKGLVKNGTINTSVFTLPAAYRPSENLLFSIVEGAGGHARLDVNADGTVIPVNGNTSFISLNVYFKGTTSVKVQRRSEISNVVVPEVGATVLVAFERGTRRLPRCLGEIQSLEYVRAEES